MIKKDLGWRFENSYVELPNTLLSKLKPTPVKYPELIIFNYELSKALGLDISGVSENELASIFSGNELPTGSETIAQAYAGHQFGHFTILGDGRALMLGEHITKDNKRLDIQFKGSGLTPYSRNADGRASLDSMLREYLISECVYNLGIPTTRSLSVVKTGENVIRETNLDGGILTRVASSHIRVGTFQFALVSQNQQNLKPLFDYTIKRHYPNLINSTSAPLKFLENVLDKQIDLICNWMRVGFIHGVMNTDNMTISGETIDYGPCAFMDRYDPNTVFSSIDNYGRYSFFNQPRIAKWNLERFAESLLPLISKDSEKSIEKATEVLEEFSDKYKKKWLTMMKGKLGLFGDEKHDEQLIFDLLNWMHKNEVDYTNTFCHLMNELSNDNEVYRDKYFIEWRKKWKDRTELNNAFANKSLEMMKVSNPLVIPRNHLVEDVLKDATKNQDLFKMRELLSVVRKPREHMNLLRKYQSLPKKESKKYVTYCGT